jgi:raffinose/stachyose/melibiose transport system substrate-binding protein
MNIFSTIKGSLNEPRALIAATLAGALFHAMPSMALELKLESWRKDDKMFWEQTLIPAFEKKHPGIKVRFTPENPIEYDAKLDARLANQNAGDLIFCRPFDNANKLYQRAQLATLPPALLLNFDENAKKPWTTDDGKDTFCVPVAEAIHGVFYNKRIFKEMGLVPPKTQKEFFQLLAKIKAQRQEIPLALGTADMWEATQVVFTGAGPSFWAGEKGRQALMNGQAKFTDPGFVKAWQFLADLRPYLPLDFATFSNSDAQLMFASENAVLFPTGSWDIPWMRYTKITHRKNLVDFGVFKFPPQNLEDQCQVSRHPDFGIGLNAASPNKEAAMLFLKWLGSRDFATIMPQALSGFFSLSNYEIETSDLIGEEMLSWGKECAETVRLNSEKLNRVWPSMEEELWLTNVNVLHGRKSPAEAAAYIQKINERNRYIPQRQ